jgi:hypothetical protein
VGGGGGGGGGDWCADHPFSQLRAELHCEERSST